MLWHKLTDLETGRTGWKTILQIVIGIIIFFGTNLLASFVVDSFYLATKFPYSFILVLARGFFEIVLFILAMKIYVEKGLRRKLSFFRITVSGISFVYIAIAVLLPLAVVLFYIFFTSGTLVYGKSESLALNLAFAVKAGLSAGICEEILFRAYIMKLVEHRWGKTKAVLLPSLFFASLHAMKSMGSIDLVLLLVAGTLAGVMFSFIAYSNNSVGNSIIVHTFWNMIILGIVTVSPSEDRFAIIHFMQNTGNLLLTGGKFGIESGLPAILAYGMVIFIAIFYTKRNNFKATAEESV